MQIEVPFDQMSTWMQVEGQEFSREALRQKAAAITEVALRALLYHLKPGRAGVLYTLACHACRQRMSATPAGATAGEETFSHTPNASSANQPSSDGGQEMQSCLRGVAVIRCLRQGNLLLSGMPRLSPAYICSTCWLLSR